LGCADQPKPAMAALKAKLAATTALKKGAEKGKEDADAAAAAADGEAKPAAKAKPIPSYLRPTAAGKAKQAEVKHQYKVRWGVLSQARIQYHMHQSSGRRHGLDAAPLQIQPHETLSGGRV